MDSIIKAFGDGIKYLVILGLIGAFCLMIALVYGVVYLIQHISIGWS